MTYGPRRHGGTENLFSKCGVLGALAIALFVGACSYGKGPINLVAGQRFPADVAAQLTPGMFADEIRKLVGEPSAVEHAGDKETWKYSYETSQQEVIKFLWIIPVPSKERGGRYTATLAFQNGRFAEKVIVQ